MNKDLSRISGYNGVGEIAVCVGCRETKVSLTKLDHDRDKEKSHQWQRQSRETVTGKQRWKCLRAEERVVPV